MTDILQRTLERARKQSREDSPLLDLHPELADRIPILRAYSDEVASGAMSAFGKNASTYIRHTWTHKAIKVIADNVAPLRLEVIRGEGDEREVVDDHALVPLLRQPNEAMDASTFWREWVTDMMLGGEQGEEVVYRRDGAVGELWPRQPHIFSVRPGPGGLRYRRVASYVIDDQEAKAYPLKPEEFIHFKFYNPLNVWRGVAPITAVRMGIIIDELAQAWSRLFFRNQARPDYAVITDEPLTKTEVDDLEIKLQAKFGRPEGWHQALVMQEGIKDVKQLSFAPKDLAWLEQRKLSRDEVGAIFGVPDEIMGYGRDTYENFPTAFRVLWTVTIFPLIGFRDAKLTAFMRQIEQLAPDEYIETDRSGIPKLPEDLEKAVTRFKDLVSSGVPPNVAANIADLPIPELEGGDVGYLPLSMIPTTRLPGAQSEQERPSSGDDGNGGGSAEEDEDEQEEQLSLRSDRWHLGQGAPPYGSEDHKQLSRRRRRLIRPLVDGMKRRLRKFWQAQQIRVGRAVRDSRELGRGRFKDFDDPADLIAEVSKQADEFFDREDEIRRFQEEFGDVIAEAVRLMAEAELVLIGLDPELLDVSRPEVQAAIRHILETVSLNTQNRVWEDLISLFEEAEADGVGIVEIQSRLSTFYGDLKSDWQTERIARTTMTGAQNSGALAAWEQSEVVKGSAWVSALIPGRTRDAHAAAHGQPRKLGESFEVGGELLAYPGDPNGRADNIINCLCELAPITLEEDWPEWTPPD